MSFGFALGLRRTFAFTAAAFTFAFALAFAAFEAATVFALAAVAFLQRWLVFDLESPCTYHVTSSQLIVQTGLYKRNGQTKQTKHKSKSQNAMGVIVLFFIGQNYKLSW